MVRLQDSLSKIENKNSMLEKELTTFRAKETALNEQITQKNDVSATLQAELEKIKKEIQLVQTQPISPVTTLSQSDEKKK